MNDCPCLTRRAHEIALAELYAIMAQDRVGRRGVEEEIGQREADEVIFTFEAACFRAQGDGDVTLFRSIDLAGLELFDVVERFDDACLELVKVVSTSSILRGSTPARRATAFFA